MLGLKAGPKPWDEKREVADQQVLAELGAMKRLHQLSTHLLASTELQPIVENVLDSTMELQHADFGIIQLYNAQTKALEIVAQRGLSREFLDRFSSLRDKSSACGRAAQERTFIVIEDVLTDPGFAPHREAAAFAGVRAVQSTPLFSRDTGLLGIISTHFRRAHRPGDLELRLTGLYAHMAADAIERQRMQEALRESERRFRLLAESIPHHVFALRPDGTLSYCNQHLLNYTSLPMDQLEPKNGGWQALHPDDMEKIKAAWQQAWAHGTDYEMEERIRGRDNQYRRFLCRAVPVKDDSRPVEWFGTHTDVEELRRAEEEALQTAQANLAHVNRVAALGELTASLAHEINQPLTTILTNANACSRMLANSVLDANELKLAIYDIAAAAATAANVISRIRALMQKSPIHRADMGMNQVIEEVIKLTRSQLTKNKIALETCLAPALPPIFGDRVQLHQVLLNLVVNAIEAMASSHDPRRLWIVSQVKSNDIEVTVQDSGPGVDAPNVGKIFEAFYTTKKGGMGLGLSISRSIVAAHGGRLWAAPGEIDGASFHFTIPAQRW